MTCHQHSTKSGLALDAFTRYIDLQQQQIKHAQENYHVTPTREPRVGLRFVRRQYFKNQQEKGSNKKGDRNLGRIVRNDEDDDTGQHDTARALDNFVAELVGRVRLPQIGNRLS